MKVTKDLLFEAAGNAGIPAGQIDALWQGLTTAAARQRKYDPLQVACYFGATIVIGAVTYFFKLAWELVGGLGILAMALTYGCIFCMLGLHLSRARNLRVAGGLLTAVAICTAPVAVFGLESALGRSPQYNWIAMELGTIAASAIALRVLRQPFLMTPGVCALWYLLVGLVPETQQCWASVGFGMVLIVGGFLANKRTQLDYAFWLYLFGVSAFWGGLSFMNTGGPWSRLWYFLVNVLLLLASTLLDRRVFAVFGSFGVAGYLAYLIFRLFHGSLFLPMAWTVIGVGIIIATVAFQRNRARVDAFLAGLLPQELAGALHRSRQAAR